MMIKLDVAIARAREIAGNDDHGYSQTRRSKGKEGDCSKNTIDCLNAAGFNFSPYLCTDTMLKPLLAAGFVDVTKTVNLKTGKGLKKSDVCLRPKTKARGGHAILVLEDDGAEIFQNAGDFDGIPGDSSGKEICIIPIYNSPFTYVLRYPELTYQSHIESVGWQAAVKEGEISGTVGKSKRLEAVIISSDSVQYRAHVQDIGWQIWHKGGQTAGTVGQGKRLEAIEIILIGDMASTHDVMYQVHVQDIGWQDWKKNGETAGTVGQSKRVEAIRIKIIKK